MTPFKGKNGTIFDIQRFSIQDGPGIRTTVFLKGCNLRCAWCHNPESQKAVPEMLFDKSKCTGCGRCRNVTASDTEFVCFSGAKRICGREYTVDEVYDEVAKDMSFYENSDGGVTFSGGECMLQAEFLDEMLKKCRRNGIHTAVDTAGDVPWKSFERVLPHTDLFLYDVKMYDSEKHRKYTGVPNELILDNLAKLFEAHAHVWVRIPVIPSVNDDDDEMKRIRDFLSHFPPHKTELLPYHAMGEHKYRELGRECERFAVPTKERMSELKTLFGL